MLLISFEVLRLRRLRSMKPSGWYEQQVRIAEYGHELGYE
jgi:hypothetical protein